MASFGVAGVFSTDDSGADQRQVDAELYAEVAEPDDPDYTALLSAGCPNGDCKWFDFATFKPNVDGDEVEARAVLRGVHATERPECDGTISFKVLD